MTAGLWLIADLALFGLLAGGIWQMIRAKNRRIRYVIEANQRLADTIVRAPVCFALGDVLTAQGQAENDCPGCAFLNSCLRVSRIMDGGSNERNCENMAGAEHPRMEGEPGTAQGAVAGGEKI